MYTGSNIVTDGLVFGYDADDRSPKFYPGEPTTNIVPSPENNGRFTTSNNWASYNTNQYNSGSYFSIGTIQSVTSNIVTTTTSHPLRSFDVVRPQTTGGGLTAGTDYVVKKISATQFSLHSYNNSENGSQGYVNPSTNFYKVHDAYATDTRISVNATSFPTMWWGYPHLPNSGLIKEIVSGGGRVPGTNCMRFHVYRGDGVADGMAYGVYCPVTVGDVITMSVWLKSSTATAVGKTLNYQTYFGPVYGTVASVNFTMGEYNKWIKYTYTWTTPITYSFYSYWFPYGSTDKYDIDIADFQVEVNKGHATQFVSGTRSSAQALIDLKQSTSINLSNISFDSTAHPTFDGTDEISISTSLGSRVDGQPLTVECVMKPGRLGGQYQDIIVNRNDWQWNWMLYQHADDGAISFHAGNTQNKSTFIPTVGKWYHVVATVTSGGICKLYINGSVIHQNNSYIYGTGQPNLLCIGAFGSLYEPYLGDIRIAKLYNKSLSDTEVQQNFNSYKIRFNI